MKIIITGANGQLGQQLKRFFKEEKLFPFNRTTLDVTNENEVNRVVAWIKPDVIIHAAAYTNVEKAEVEPYKAYETNLGGTINVANAAQKLKCQLMLISTDYVFDGLKNTPYEVNDKRTPLNIYGLSKKAAEDAAMYLCEKPKIIRTSWLVGSYGNNFVKKLLSFAKQNKTISIVNDQIGSPTFTSDLANTIEQLIPKDYGVYHVSNSGSCSWYELAREIYQLAGVSQELVKPVSSDDYKTKAKRPTYSVLSQNSLVAAGIEKPKSWQEGLKSLMEGVR